VIPGGSGAFVRSEELAHEIEHSAVFLYECVTLRKLSALLA
jgi:hypothetical protein